MNPPTNISAAELWSRITEMPRPHRTVDFPRLDPITDEPLGKLALWVLTPAEHATAAATADRAARALLVDAPAGGPGYSVVYDNFAASEMLAVACRDAGDLSKTFFPNAAAVRKHLTTDETAVLFNALCQMQAESSPIVSVMSEQEMEAWLTRLEEGGRALAPLFSLTQGQRNSLLMFLARHWSNSRTAISSPTSLPDEPTPATSSGSETSDEGSDRT